MIGHAWPVFASFRGGRSVLTFVGAMLVLAPLPDAERTEALRGIDLEIKRGERERHRSGARRWQVKPFRRGDRWMRLA